MSDKRRICIITGTRAEWGLLSPIARELQQRPGVELQIVATNMHLDPLYGHTVDAIEADGFTVDERVPMPSAADTPALTVKAMSVCMAGMADAFTRLSPDLAVILGDRTEMMATAIAAQVMRIPIAHLHGGEISEGAIDDSIRHAITKLASLHLTSTESHRRRVIQMGEDPARVINTGAIGVYNAMNVPRASLAELTEAIGFEPDSRTLLLTYHPATLDDADTSERFGALLRALDAFPDSRVIATYPNNDARGRVIIDMLHAWADERSGRVSVIPSLGMRRYLSVLPLIGAVVGNSSSGIIEVPSAGIPTVDIGMRQQGRTAADSVIHCGDSTEEIRAAIAVALDPQTRARAAATVNPYYRPDTLRLIADALCLTPLEQLRHKKFYDTNQ